MNICDYGACFTRDPLRQSGLAFYLFLTMRLVGLYGWLLAVLAPAASTDEIAEALVLGSYRDLF